MPNRLTTQQMMDVALKMAKINDLIDLFGVAQQFAELHVRVEVFEAVVWFPHLQAQVNAVNDRGLSCLFRGIKLMTWCCAGRCLIQLERNGHRLTLITADDEKPWNRDNCHVAPGMGPMGIQGIDADAIEALILLYEATRYHDEIHLIADENVTIG